MQEENAATFAQNTCLKRLWIFYRIDLNYHIYLLHEMRDAVSISRVVNVCRDVLCGVALTSGTENKLWQWRSSCSSEFAPMFHNKIIPWPGLISGSFIKTSLLAQTSLFKENVEVAAVKLNRLIIICCWTDGANVELVPKSNMQLKVDVNSSAAH